MNIAYSTDENYAVHAYISLQSLLDHNRDEKEIICYLIDNRMSQETLNSFQTLMNFYQNENCKRILKIIDFIPYEKIVINATPCGSLSTYGRIFLPELQGVDRVLYIDCDTIITGELRELYDEDLTDYAVAGVQDIVAFPIREKVGLRYGDRYINAGVALLNLEYWRNNDGERRCLDFIKAYGGKVPFEDQGTINGVFKGHIKIVSPKFNMMNSLLDYSGSQISVYMDVENYYTDSEITAAKMDIRIVHFTAGYYQRPWYQNSNHPYAKIYLSYRAKSPWRNTPLLDSMKEISKKERVLHSFRMWCPLAIYRILKKMVKSFRTLKKK